MAMKVHGMPWTYHHDEWSKWLLKPRKIPEEALYEVLYGKGCKIPESILVNEQLTRLYHTYKSGSVKYKTFQKYVNMLWNRGNKNLSDNTIKFDLRKAYISVAKLEEIAGPFTPIFSIYKNVNCIVDNVSFVRNKATAVFIFWVASMMDMPEAINISSTYALSRTKLLYIDHGLRIKNIMVFFPESELGYKMPMDYRYPIEVIIEMAASGLTIGGYFDRIPFEPRNISGMRIRI